MIRSPGEIPDVRHPVEGQQVVHAQRVKRDRPRDDQLVIAVVVGKGGRLKRLRRQQLGIRVGHPARRLLKRLGVDVGAERPQQLPSGTLHGGMVDLAVVSRRSRMVLPARVPMTRGRGGVM